MKFNRQEVGHGLGEIPSTTFLVSARQGNYCRQFIVIAENGDAAIIRLKKNAEKLIETIRHSLTQADDFLEKKIMAPPSDAQLKLAQGYEEGIAIMQDKLDALGEKTDELSMVHRESLTENIKENYAAIKKCREPREVGLQSKFHIMTKRAQELLDPITQFTVQPLSAARCYSTAYFDDERDYSTFVG